MLVIGGILALRLGEAGTYLDSGSVRLFSWPVGFSWPEEILRSAGIGLGLAGLLRLAFGRGAERSLSSLALPLFLVLSLVSTLLPVPSAFGYLGSRTLLFLLAAAFGTVWSLGLRRPDGPVQPTRAWEGPAVFLLFALLLASVLPKIPGTGWLRQSASTGDEPEYLLTIISLLDDGDVRLRNNSDQDAAREFGASGFRFPLPLPIHNIGLPLLAAPAYALGRWVTPDAPQKLVWLQMAWFMALLASELYLLLRPRGWILGLVAASSVLLPPLLPMSVQVYPETPAAALAVLIWRRLSVGKQSQILPALALFVLPWLHVKYSALAAGLLTAAAVLHGPRRSVLGASSLFLSLLVLSVFSGLHYDSWLPTASYGRTTTVLSAGILQGSLGLWLDQSFGLLARAPVFLLALPGILVLLARDFRQAAALFLIVASLFSVVASYHLWWAGWSPPARFLVPIVPFLLLLVLECFTAKRSVLACSTGFLWLLGLAAGALLVPPPPTWLGGSRALIYQDPVEPSGFEVLLSSGFDLAGLLPQMATATARDWALGLCIGTAALLAGLFLFRLRRRELNGPRPVTIWLLVLLLGSGGFLEIFRVAFDRFWPDHRWHHAQNQSIRAFLPIAAEPERHRIFPGWTSDQLPQLLQRFEAEGLRGNHAFFQDLEDPSASGGLQRCTQTFDPKLAPIPIAFRPTVEFVPWPAGLYTATFRLDLPKNSTAEGLELPESPPEDGLAVALAVRSPFSECAIRPALLVRRELAVADLRNGPVDVELRFQLRCLTPKLEWLADAFGPSVCLDRVQVRADSIVVR